MNDNGSEYSLVNTVVIQMRREQMTAVVSQITHYRCHCVMGISDKSVPTMPTMVVSGMRSSREAALESCR